MSPISSERMNIINKVVKLLALAEGSSFEAEREAASNMAAELMAKNNVKMADITTAEFEIVEVDSGHKLKDPIESVLMNAVCAFCDVTMYNRGSSVWRPGRVNNFVFVCVGRTQDVEAAQYMFDQIKNQMSAALATYRKERGLKFTEMKLKEKNEYRRGFAYGVSNKIYALIAAQNAKIQEWGLVPVSPAALAKKWYEESHKTRAGRSSSASYSAAAYKAGQNCPINRGVDSTSKRLRIGA